MVDTIKPGPADQDKVDPTSSAPGVAPLRKISGLDAFVDFALKRKINATADETQKQKLERLRELLSEGKFSMSNDTEAYRYVKKTLASPDYDPQNDIEKAERLAQKIKVDSKNPFGDYAAQQIGIALEKMATSPDLRASYTELQGKLKSGELKIPNQKQGALDFVARLNAVDFDPKEEMERLKAQSNAPVAASSPSNPNYGLLSLTSNEAPASVKLGPTLLDNKDDAYGYISGQDATGVDRTSALRKGFAAAKREIVEPLNDKELNELRQHLRNRHILRKGSHFHRNGEGGATVKINKSEKIEVYRDIIKIKTSEPSKPVSSDVILAGLEAAMHRFPGKDGGKSFLSLSGSPEYLMKVYEVAAKNNLLDKIEFDQSTKQATLEAVKARHAAMAASGQSNAGQTTIDQKQVTQAQPVTLTSSPVTNINSRKKTAGAPKMGA